MSESVITIGRGVENYLVIKDPEVSARHATITNLGNGSFLIEDRDSLNGTWINGNRVQKATVTGKDQVTLSRSTVLNIPALFKVQPEGSAKKQGDYQHEFLTLKKIYETYQQQRLQITKRYQMRAMLFKGALMVTPMLVWVICKSISPERFKFAFIYFSVSGSVLVSIASSLLTLPQKKLTALQEEFQVNYLCPSCKIPLGPSPAVLEKIGKCTRCNAIFSSNGGKV